MRALVFTLACPLLVLAACSEKSEAPAAAAAITPTAPLEIAAETNAQSFRMEPKAGGYSLTSADGSALGAVLLKAEQVAVRDATGRVVVRIDQQKHGFQVKDGDGIVAFRGRSAEGQQKIVSATGDEFAVVQEGRIQVGGEVITAVPRDGHMVVGRSGRRMLSVKGEVVPHAAAFLGVTELSPHQRVGLLVFFRDVLPKHEPG
jgi:hypothetical protein